MKDKKAIILSALMKKNGFKQRVIVKENLKVIIESTEEIEKILKNFGEGKGSKRLTINNETGEYAYGFTGDVIAAYIDSQGIKYELRIQYIKR
jgi:hypothetical protein